VDQSVASSVRGLGQFLRFASVSTDPGRAGDIHRCAQWLARQFQEAGLAATVEPTGGHPIVLARSERVAGRPTLLLYGHYDVQPAEPLEQWTTPPFEPAVRKDPHGFDAIYARGASDDKGQVWAHVQAIAAWNRCAKLPVNLLAVIEGEEEIGSPHLAQWMQENRQQLKADVAIISDSGQYARGVPAITCGLRGLVYAEVMVHGPSHDLHSGIYGGAVANPANALCALLATLHDAQGRVNVPGFYDDVAELSAAQRQAWNRLGTDEPAMAAELGVPALWGEKGFSALERRWARPTCDINGLSSGYQGPGAKTIIPASASAKVSMRLVPNQKASNIYAGFERALRQRCPAGVRLEVIQHSGADPSLVSEDSAALRCGLRAVQTGFGAAPVLIREGGSIPVVGLIKSILGIDTLLVGFGLPDDRVHSPNEKFDLAALHAGTRTAAALYQELSALGRSS
jgi:acetylornithine deacetylase/succinyl-diaminopimelate desuccinylase-like protein